MTHKAIDFPVFINSIYSYLSGDSEPLRKLAGVGFKPTDIPDLKEWSCEGEWIVKE